MTTADYLNYIVNEIHRTIVATVDEEGLPVTCAIDMMDCDEDSLYFLTATFQGLQLCVERSWTNTLVNGAPVDFLLYREVRQTCLLGRASPVAQQ